MKPREIFYILSFAVLALITLISFIWSPIVWSLVFFGPVIIIGYYDAFQKKQSIKRNFPVIGHFRYILEEMRPEIMQYFVETDTEGRPINRIFRSLIYQRAKKAIDTTPFGTQLDVYEAGYEWMEHLVYAKNSSELEKSPRILIGGSNCKQPYSASILNIPAMSFGSLSQNAVLSMNKGVKLGGFAQNTGEGGISPYHLQHGGDLIWQIGTGYFGCRDNGGNFHSESFK